MNNQETDLLLKDYRDHLKIAQLFLHVLHRKNEIHTTIPLKMSQKH